MPYRLWCHQRWPVFLLLLSLPFSALAFPIGAGDCPEGQAAVGSVHLSASTVTTGSLEDYNFQVEINGRALQPGESAINTIQSGVENSWMLVAGSGEGFRGFLLRLGGGEEEIDTTVALSSANSNVKEAFAACVLSQGVGGVTHTENGVKPAVFGILRLDEIASNLTLDVTVVVENRNSNSTYFYSAYSLNFREEAQPGSPTAAPITSIPGGSTALPTVSPTRIPTVGPTLIPTLKASSPEPAAASPTQQLMTQAPIESPTDAAIDTAAPTAPQTQATTESPTDALANTTAPTTSPTSSPVLAPGTITEEPQEKQLTMVLGRCSRGRPCELCEGDCNRDEDCVGDLECYRRPGDYDTPIPGCGGMGTKGVDYCYQPSDLTLRLRSPFCSAKNPCDLCQGDCNGDNECVEGLKCFHRSYMVEEKIPGCEGLGIQGLDYCYDDESQVDGDDESEVDGCDTDDDCLPVACSEEPCLTNVCRQSKCTLVEQCGPRECGADEYCCNSSCGICAPLDGVCIQVECEQCGDAICNAGDTCCGPDCDLCAPPGESCPDLCFDPNAGDSIGVELEACESDKDCAGMLCGEEPCFDYVCRDLQCVMMEQCGNNECNPEVDYCCNSSCGICAPLGGSCIQEFCEACGNDICNAGDSCCSPDCDICAPPGGSCPVVCLGQDGGEGNTTAPELEGPDGGEENIGPGEENIGPPELESCESEADCKWYPCDEEPCLEYVCRDSKCILVEGCGNNECNPEVDYCCNSNCGVCAPLEGGAWAAVVCDEVVCEQCGDVTCNPGDTCCNPDCGICQPPGGSCPADCVSDYWDIPSDASAQEEQPDDIEEAENSDNDYWSINTVDEENQGEGEDGGCQSDDECAGLLPCALEPCALIACRNSTCALVQPCGENECNEFEYCCNESCSICVPFDNDVGCTNEFCDFEIDDSRTDEEEEVGVPEYAECVEDLDCPVFFCTSSPCPMVECRDYKCLLYIPCGTKKCVENEMCCCGNCEPLNTQCDEEDVCAPCGNSICPPGDVCCNESCGICTSPGGFCTADECFEEEEGK